MRDAIFIVLIFGIGIAAIYAFARITKKINAQSPPDYELKTYSYKRIFHRSVFGIFFVGAVSTGMYAFSRSLTLAISVGAFFLCMVLAYLVWGLYWQRWEKRRGARLEE